MDPGVLTNWIVLGVTDNFVLNFKKQFSIKINNSVREPPAVITCVKILKTFLTKNSIWCALRAKRLPQYLPFFFKEPNAR